MRRSGTGNTNLFIGKEFHSFKALSYPFYTKGILSPVTDAKEYVKNPGNF